MRDAAGWLEAACPELARSSGSDHRATARRSLGALDHGAKTAGQFAAPKARQAERPAVEVLGEPVPAQGDPQQRRAQRAAEVRPAFAPIQACAGEAAALRA